MQTVPLLRIVVPENRQRRTFDPDKHQELIASIERNGLFHAIVLRQDGDLLKLVAGERRLRAVSEIHELGGKFFHGHREGGPAWVQPGDIPYVLLGELAPLAAREAELSENIHRVDLTWQERAEAEAELVRLRQDQARAKGEPIATALPAAVEELRGEATPSASQSVARNIILANNLHRPEVRGAKSAAEAFKALQRSEEANRNAEMAKVMGKEFLGAKHKLIQGDCIDWMDAQEPGQFDVICSDPPYGMGADEFGDSGGGAAGAHFYDDSYESWQRWMPKFISGITRLAKPAAHVYLFCDFDRFGELKAWLQVAEWKVFRTPLLWHKPSAFRAPWPEHGPQRKYECIIFAIRGDMKVAKLAPDVLTYPPDENLGHPAQKPVQLIADLLSRSARAGMKVLDPCCGTGPVFPAAHALSVVAVGVEQDPAACGIAMQRIARLKGEGV